MKYQGGTRKTFRLFFAIYLSSHFQPTGWFFLGSRC